MSPGDTATYQLTYTLNANDYSNLLLTAYLPLPIFLAANPTNPDTGTNVGNVSTPASPADYTIDGTNGQFISETPATGHVALVGIGNLASSGTPAIASATANVAANSVTFNLGSLGPATSSNITNDTLVIDFTVTASSQPFVDGLFLAATGQSKNYNTPVQATTKTGTHQVELASPNLTIEKGAESFAQTVDETQTGTYTVGVSSGSTATSTTVDSTFTLAGTALGGSLRRHLQVDTVASE